PTTSIYTLSLHDALPISNTGNIGRLCLATGSTLHLVRPLGFALDDRQLHRAGLDYWQEVPVQLWESFEALQRAQPAEMRYFYLTDRKSTRLNSSHLVISY